MKKLILVLFALLISSPVLGAPSLPKDIKGNWVLQSSKITYTIKHMLKTAEGTTTEAKGKGQCDAKSQCTFLVAVPVKTFDSGNSNRDLHMLEVVKGATFPMVVAHVTVTGFDSANSQLPATAKVDFAGQSHDVKMDPVHLVMKSDQLAETDLVLPISLTQFGVERPSLLTMPIEDTVAIHIQATWQKQ